MRRKSNKQEDGAAGVNGNGFASSPPPSAPTELEFVEESSVLRYYTTKLMLRFVVTEPYLASDPALDVAVGLAQPTESSRDSALKAYEKPRFLSLYETGLIHSSSALKHASLLVVPPVNKSQSHLDQRLMTAVFTVVPAEGFEKAAGQPVYYNDPILLVDQHDRSIGILKRFPHAGHLGTDCHVDPLVLVFEKRQLRRKSFSSLRITEIDKKMPLSESKRLELESKLGLFRKSSTRTSLVEVCGGDRLSIPGLAVLRKKQFVGGCIVQQSAFASQGRSLIPNVTCEVVFTSGISSSPFSSAPLSDSAARRRTSSSTATAAQGSAERETDGNGSGTAEISADRMATGEFVGVLQFGVLYRRTDHMKMWKKRFFVLTQLALHRFDGDVTLGTVHKAKIRGTILLRDIQSVLFEKFSRPHDFDIVLHNGRLFSVHSKEAIVCTRWVSMLLHAIENPSWVHSEKSFMTIWRSDAKFISPKCPRIDQVSVLHGGCRIRDSVAALSPEWNAKINLGALYAQSEVEILLNDGKIFKLSMENLNRALLGSSWISIHTMERVDTMDAFNCASTKECPKRLSVRKEIETPFRTRLKYRTEVQLDERLHQTSDSAPIGARLVFSCVFVFNWYLQYQLHIVCPWPIIWWCLWGWNIVLLVFLPLAWQVLLVYWQKQEMRARLRWCLLPLAIEVRPNPSYLENEASALSNGGAEVKNLNKSSQVPAANANGDSLGRRSSGRSSLTNADLLGAPESDSDLSSVVSSRSSGLLSGSELLTSSAGSTTMLMSPMIETIDPMESAGIRDFRVENGVDAILGMPHMNFFAIKRFFPHHFLTCEENADIDSNIFAFRRPRRCLFLPLDQVNWDALHKCQVTEFNVQRYFVFLWEYLWSYLDVKEDVESSDLMIVMDCRMSGYSTMFRSHLRVIYRVLLMTLEYYPNRLAKVVLVRDSFWQEKIWMKLFRAVFPTKLARICVEAQSLEEVLGPTKWNHALLTMKRRSLSLGHDALTTAVNRFSKASSSSWTPPVPMSGAHLGSFDLPGSIIDPICAPKSSEELALYEFEQSILASAAMIVIPSFSKRELEQAVQFTRHGHLKHEHYRHHQHRDAVMVSSDVQVHDPHASESKGKPLNETKTGKKEHCLDIFGNSTKKNSSSYTDPSFYIDTKALLIPKKTFDWKQVYHAEGFTMWKTAAAAVETESTKDAGPIAQWRGKLEMKASKTEMMLCFLQDPTQWRLWNPYYSEMVVLDGLSRQEDVSLWSRFVSVHKTPNRVVPSWSTCERRIGTCLVRRIYEEKARQPGSHPFCYAFWKTTTAQRIVYDSMTQESIASKVPAVWRSLEDPLVNMCVVLEPNSLHKPGVPGTTLWVWIQRLETCPTPNCDNIEFAKHIETMYRSLDDYLLSFPTDK